MKQYKHPKVTRRKMSNSAKQAWLLRDRVMTEEQKVKIGESMKLAWKNHLFDKKKHLRHHFKEWNQKISQAVKRSWSKRERHLSEETKEKMRKSKLALEDFKGNKGCLKHRQYIEQIAKKLKREGRDVEIEKAIKVNHHWRIIDILVDEKICYEIGFCKSDKINELNNNGFSVVHLPYQELNNKNMMVFGVS